MLVQTRQLVPEESRSSTEATALIEGRYGRHIKVRAGRNKGRLHLFYFHSRREAEIFAGEVLGLALPGVLVAVDWIGYQYLVSVTDNEGNYAKQN